MADDEVKLRPPGLAEDIAEDYAQTGLTLRDHPLSLIRANPPWNRCCLAAELAHRRSGSFVRVGGLVTGRQRPGTAKGTLFVTLEDETGNINLVVWPALLQQFRAELLASSLLLVKGRVEVEQGVVHVIAGQVEDRSDDLEGLSLKARNFR